MNGIKQKKHIKQTLAKYLLETLQRKLQVVYPDNFDVLCAGFFVKERFFDVEIKGQSFFWKIKGREH